MRKLPDSTAHKVKAVLHQNDSEFHPSSNLKAVLELKMLSPLSKHGKTKIKRKFTEKGMSSGQMSGSNRSQQLGSEDTSKVYMSLSRPWPQTSATSLCLAGVCDPYTNCTCLKASKTTRALRSYPLDSQDNTYGILANKFEEDPASSTYSTPLPDFQYLPGLSSYPHNTVSTMGELGTSCVLDARCERASPVAGIPVPHGEMTPLQRFEAELPTIQPYNTVSSYRFLYSSITTAPQVQNSHITAYNGSDLDGPASEGAEM